MTIRENYITKKIHSTFFNHKSNCAIKIFADNTTDVEIIQDVLIDIGCIWESESGRLQKLSNMKGRIFIYTTPDENDKSIVRMSYGQCPIVFAKSPQTFIQL